MNHNYLSSLKYLSLLMVLLITGGCAYLGINIQSGEPSFQPEKSIAEANELIKKGFYEDAIVILEEVKAKDATRKYALLAMIRIADSYYADRLYDKAIVEYENFLQIYPHHKYSSYAQYKLAMCYFKRIKTVDVSYYWAERSIEEFEKLLKTYPRNPYMSITESRIKVARNMIAKYEFFVGHFYFKKGSYAAAAGRFRDLLREYSGLKIESEALYYLGLSYANMGQRENAVKTLNELIEKFPSLELSTAAKEQIVALNENWPQLKIKK